MSGQQVIERVWQAPIGLVWELWTQGRASWFGPRGFEVEVDEFDLKVGGAFRYTMRAASPEMAEMMKQRGKPSEFSVAATVTVVDPPFRLTYDSPHGEETLTTAVEFTETSDGVKMVLTIDATKPEMTGGAAMGWKSSLDRFAEQLSA